jgi:hypothetical protein
MGTAGRRRVWGEGWRPRPARAGTPGACPGPEVLAGYVERRLDPGASVAVGAHLARCPRCRFVVGEAVFFLRGET